MGLLLAVCGVKEKAVGYLRRPGFISCVGKRTWWISVRACHVGVTSCLVRKTMGVFGLHGK